MCFRAPGTPHKDLGSGALMPLSSVRSLHPALPCCPQPARKTMERNLISALCINHLSGLQPLPAEALFHISTSQTLNNEWPWLWEPWPSLAPSSQQWFLNDSHCCYWSSCGLTALPFPALLFVQWFLLPALLQHLILLSSRTLLMMSFLFCMLPEDLGCSGGVSLGV